MGTPDRLNAMCIPDMFGLRSVQPKIFYGVIAWVAVYVMNDLARFKIAAKMLLHNVTMFKDVLQSVWLFLIRWIWVIVGGGNKGISVLSYSASAFPVGGKLPALTKHWIRLSNHAHLTVHRIFVAAYISMIGRVSIGKIAGGNGTTARTVFFVRGRELPEVFTALNARNKLAFSFEFSGTFARAKARLDAREGFINPFTVFASTFYHALNYTPYRTVKQLWM